MNVPSCIMTDKSANIANCSELLRSREISPLKLVAACIRRIEELNARLNAFITVLPECALEEARVAEAELNAGNWRGPLHGIPVAVKDFYDTAGIKTTAAFDLFRDRVPAKDAAVVARLKQAGAIIIGKTNMRTLGRGTTGLESYLGPAHNPWSAEHIPGGSSSGSAVAVATGMCYATVDTDAIGSCRLPAACCGVVGFKGTYGLINPQGILAGEEDPGEMIHWFSHPGIMTRTVHEAALVVDVLKERAEISPVQATSAGSGGAPIRIGVADNFGCDREIHEGFEKSIETIRSLGYSLTRVHAPLQVPADNLSNIAADRRDVIGTLFREIDALVLPTTATTVPKIKDSDGSPQTLSAENTIFANYFGLPAISVPSCFDQSGLPTGLQIVGKPWSENVVFRLAQEFEGANRDMRGQ